MTTGESGNISSAVPHCMICGNANQFTTTKATILSTFPTSLVHCQICDFEWFSGANDWLDKAYQNPIADTDTGIVRRNMELHPILSSLFMLGASTSKFLDWGSGSGLLIRMLRDDGLDCIGFEPFTEPVLAPGFTYKQEHVIRSKGPFHCVIAIEVVEHLLSPVEFFQSALSLADTIIFTTELTDSKAQGEDWWYYSKDTGQHISFYSRKSLKLIATSFGASYQHTRGQSLHMITRDQRQAKIFKLACGNHRSKLIYMAIKTWQRLSRRPKSLIMQDHFDAKNRLKSPIN
jgi:hypothetical protein